MANKVFEDRLGIYIRGTENLAGRLPSIKAFGFADVFLPPTAQPADLARVRGLGLSAHMWWATDDLTPKEYAARALENIDRLGPGAGELNIELPTDAALPGYVEEVVRIIRAKRRSYRLRINLAPLKGFAIPQQRLAEDPNLYVAAQNYKGDMSPFSDADVLTDLLAWGAPREKATVCYGAHGPVPGSNGKRVCTLPELRWPMRGVVYNDDLMADAGFLP